MKTIEVRVNVRECSDGWVRALIGDDEPAVLLQVPAIPYNACKEVRAKFHELTLALFKQALQQADPEVEVGQIRTVPPGADADTAVH